VEVRTMSGTLPGTRGTTTLAEALDALVARGTISTDQRAAILVEVGESIVAAPGPRAAGPRPPSRRARRSLTDILVEIGLYLGSALVLAALVAIVAQAWGDLADNTRITVLVATALVTGLVGWILSRSAAVGSARRRLAGVVLCATAGSAAGTVGLVLGDEESTGVVALAVALAILVAAQVLASSAITEIGMFAVAWALLAAIGAWLQPEGTVTYDAFGGEVYEPSTFEQLMPLGMVAFGLLWALVVARALMHRELAVALGVFVAFVGAMPLAGTDSTRVIGLAALAAIAAVGFWRFLVEGRWPWLVGAIASVTGFVFWAVGGNRSPALAFLIAGVVMLACSGLGWRVARHRRSAIDAGEQATPT
jgi:hypothetical protein